VSASLLTIDLHLNFHSYLLATAGVCTDLNSYEASFKYYSKRITSAGSMSSYLWN